MTFELRDLIIAAMATFLIFNHFAPPEAPTPQGSSYEQIEENIVRAQTKVVEDIILPKLSKQIEDRLTGDVIAAAVVKAQVKGGWVKKEGKQDAFTKKHPQKKRNDLAWKDEKGVEFPIGALFYDVNKETWKGKAYNLELDTTIVQQLKYDGTYETYVEAWARHQNLKAKNGGGGRHPLEIREATFQIKVPTKLTWSWWNPTISGGLYATLPQDFGFMAKINVMNYGYEAQLPVYQFLSPVAMFNTNQVEFGIEIGSVNLGEWVPLIKDLHLGAGITIPKYKPFIGLTSVF